MNKLKIYLAGPDVFRSNAVEHLAELKRLCSEMEFEGLAPLDNVIEIDINDMNTKKHSGLIFTANVELIKECDIIIANLIPFRGACIDDGTAWEIGCGFALGKKVFGYTEFCDFSLVNVTKFMFDLDKQPEFPEVEDFGNPVNLMISDSILKSGGAIFKSFSDCLNELKKQAV